MRTAAIVKQKTYAGLVIMLIGLFLVFVVPIPTKEVQVREELFKDKTLNTGESYNYLKKRIAFGENITPPVVTAIATESEEQHFNFYVFDELNFEIFKEGREDFVAVRSARDASIFSFIFTPKVGDYYFVASTVVPPIPRILMFTAIIEYQKMEKDRTIQISGVFAIVVGLAMLGIPWIGRLR